VDYYSSFISSNGGRTNAYTDDTNTLYYFNIQNTQFEKALDIFSEFFSKPLLSSEYVSKEMNAVNSEFQKNKNSDNWREWNLLSFSSKASSIFNRFSTGNLETLDIPDIYQRLKGFYDNQYR
jgi:insulysin